MFSTQQLYVNAIYKDPSAVCSPDHHTGLHLTVAGLRRPLPLDLAVGQHDQIRVMPGRAGRMAACLCMAVISHVSRQPSARTVLSITLNRADGIGIWQIPLGATRAVAAHQSATMEHHRFTTEQHRSISICRRQLMMIEIRSRTRQYQRFQRVVAVNLERKKIVVVPPLAGVTVAALSLPGQRVRNLEGQSLSGGQAHGRGEGGVVEEGKG